LLLPRSIASALRAVAVLRRQAVPGEVLVIDDGSRDGSLALLRQLETLYFDAGLRVLALARNSGLAAARNHALVQARYRYIVYMDADNEIIPDNLPLFLQALRQTEAAAVYGNLLFRSVTSRCAFHVLSNESVQYRLFEGNYVDAFAMCDRIQVLDAGGYDASCAAHEDYELWLHLVCSGRRIVFVPLVFGYYYMLPSSMITDYEKNNQVNARVQRIFNQVKARKHLPLNTDRLRYHPMLGYL
jgi:glycosyltransferase involved in cell wall biosynthesis